MARMTAEERARRRRERKIAAKYRGIETEIAKRAEGYAAGSNIKNEQARGDLCLGAAGLYAQYWRALLLSLSGEGAAEENRTIPALFSNYNRTMDRIGVTAEKLTPEEEEL